MYDQSGPEPRGFLLIRESGLDKQKQQSADGKLKEVEPSEVKKVLLMGEGTYGEVWKVVFKNQSYAASTSLFIIEGREFSSFCCIGHCRWRFYRFLLVFLCFDGPWRAPLISFCLISTFHLSLLVALAF